MTFTGFSEDAFTFYDGLRADNSKTYWTAHKHVYDECVREPMQALLDSLAPTFGGDAVLFRPYRDVRFSADKTPYKTAQGGFIDIVSGVGYWMQLDADAIWVGGGFHAHDKAQTARYRAAVDDDRTGGELVALMTKLTRAGFEVGGAAVKTRPRGVAADHPRLDLMRHENLTVHREIPPHEAADAAFAKTLASSWRKITPLIEWCQEYAPPS